MEPGDRMLIRCEGGPAMVRAVHFPPPLEIETTNGRYVLVDDGPPDHWTYQFIASTGDR